MLISKYANAASRAEIERILSHALKCSRAELYVNDTSLDKETAELCSSLISRRLTGEPLQYIIGSTEFMGLDFVVNKDVFIPRPETELLVNEALRIASDKRRTMNDGLKVLDLCTGCGNIAISLARLMPCAEIIATDISEAALRVARKNSIMHGANRDIAFFKGDLFGALPFDKKYKFDIIVCNPPYIKMPEIETLQEEVRHEPVIALNGGIDGLDFYRRIARFAPDYLRQEGSLLLEIGFGQTQGVKNIFCLEGPFEMQKIEKDFSDIERVVWISLS